MYHLRIVSLLIFCFDDLSISVSGVLKSPTIILLLSVSFMSVSVCLIVEVFLCWVHRHLLGDSRIPPMTKVMRKEA